MSHISSINFKKTNVIQARHNDRDLPPNYLIGGNFEVNHNYKQALELKNKIIYEAINAYNKNKPPKAPSFKAKSYEWSAVCNIKPETTMQDLQNLAQHFEDKYGFQCYQIAIHRDEGHINEKGEKIINQHAHLEFITLDKHTGKNNYRRELITPKILRQIQTEVAEILQMKRGQDKRITGVKRIEPRKYAQMKEQEKKATLELKEQILSLKEQKTRLEQERKAWIAEKTHTAEEYKALRALAEKGKTAEKLEAEIKALKEQIEQSKKTSITNGDSKQIVAITSPRDSNTICASYNSTALTKSNDLAQENELLRQENTRQGLIINEMQTAIGDIALAIGREGKTLSSIVTGVKMLVNEFLEKTHKNTLKIVENQKNDITLYEKKKMDLKGNSVNSSDISNESDAMKKIQEKSLAAVEKIKKKPKDRGFER